MLLTDPGTWFHFLCKNIKLEHNGKVKSVISHGPAGFLSQADESWQKAGFFLKWRDKKLQHEFGTLSPEQSHARETNDGAPRFDNVICCCWGAPASLVQRFGDIVRTSSWTHALHDPFVVLDVVLDELFLLLDRQKDHLRLAFRDIESVSGLVIFSSGVARLTW